MENIQFCSDFDKTKAILYQTTQSNQGQGWVNGHLCQKIRLKGFEQVYTFTKQSDFINRPLGRWQVRWGTGDGRLVFIKDEEDYKMDLAVFAEQS